MERGKATNRKDGDTKVGIGECTVSENRGSFFVNLRICLVSQITSTSLPRRQLIQLIKSSLPVRVGRVSQNWIRKQLENFFSPVDIVSSGYR